MLLWTLVGLGLSAAAYAVFRRANAPGRALPAPTRPPDLATLTEAVRQLRNALSSPDATASFEQAQAALASAWTRIPDPLRERLMARGVPDNRVTELTRAPRPTDGPQRRRLLELAEALVADLDLT